MNITSIIKEFEQKQAELEAARKEELERERIARLCNAQAIEARIKTIAEPVMEACRSQLANSGYQCDVTVEFKKDSKYPESKKERALGIRLRTGKNKLGAADSHLRYIGGYDGLVLQKELWINNHPESQTLPLEAFTQEFVESEIESFLKRVFTI